MVVNHSKDFETMSGFYFLEFKAKFPAAFVMYVNIHFSLKMNITSIFPSLKLPEVAVRSIRVNKEALIVVNMLLAGLCIYRGSSLTRRKVFTE